MGFSPAAPGRWRVQWLGAGEIFSIPEVPTVRAPVCALHPTRPWAALTSEGRTLVLDLEARSLLCCSTHPSVWACWFGERLALSTTDALLLSDPADFDRVVHALSVSYSAAPGPLLGGKALFVPVADRRSVILGGSGSTIQVAAVIEGIRLEVLPDEGVPELLRAPGEIWALENLEEALDSASPLGEEPLQQLRTPAVTYSRETLAWLSETSDRPNSPHRAVVAMLQGSETKPFLQRMCTANLSGGVPDGLPEDWLAYLEEHTEKDPNRLTIEQVQLAALAPGGLSAMLRCGSTPRLVLAIAEETEHPIALERLAELDRSLEDGELLMITTGHGPDSANLFARVGGRHSGRALGRRGWDDLWETASYYLFGSGRHYPRLPFLDELGEFAYLQRGHLDLLDRPEAGARALVVEAIERSLMSTGPHAAPRLLAALEVVCEAVGDRLHRVACRRLRARIAELDHDPDPARYSSALQALDGLVERSHPVAIEILISWASLLAESRDPAALPLLEEALAHLRSQAHVLSPVPLADLARALSRMGRQAEVVEIVRTRPDLIGGDALPLHGARLCFDLLEALAALGRHEEVITTCDAWDHKFPSSIDWRRERDRSLRALGCTAEDATVPPSPGCLGEDEERALDEHARSLGIAITIRGCHARSLSLWVEPLPVGEPATNTLDQHRAWRHALGALRQSLHAQYDSVELHETPHTTALLRRAVPEIEALLLAHPLVCEVLSESQPPEVITWGHVQDREDQIRITIRAHGPRAVGPARDLGVLCAVLVRDLRPDLDEIPLAPRVEHREADIDPGTSDLSWQSEHVRALLEEIHEAPLRDQPIAGLEHRASRLYGEMRALCEALARHQIDEIDLGPQLWINAETIASMAGSSRRFLVAYDLRRGIARTLVGMERDGMIGLEWIRGIARQVRPPGPRTQHGRSSLGSVLAEIERSRRDAPARWLARVDVLRTTEDAQRARAREARLSRWGMVWLRPALRTIEGAERAERAALERWSALPCDVLFVSDGDRDQIYRILPGGEQIRIDLPSPDTYRYKAALSPDRRRLFVTSRTLAREIDLASGRMRFVFEGAVLTSIAALSGGYVAVSVRGGTHRLDRTDPDVAALSSPEQWQWGSTTSLETASGIALIGPDGTTRFVRSSNYNPRIRAVHSGQVLIVEAWGRWWKTAVLAFEDGQLAVLAKLPESMGEVREVDGHILGRGGCELIGLEAALLRARPGFLQELSYHELLEGVFRQRPLIETSDPDLLLVAVGPRPHGPPLDLQWALELSAHDALGYDGPDGPHPLIRDGTLHLLHPDPADAGAFEEIPTTPSLSLDAMVWTRAESGQLLFAGSQGLWSVSPEAGRTVRLGDMEGSPHAIVALDADRVLTSCQSPGCRTLSVRRNPTSMPGGWVATTRVEITTFDRMYLLGNDLLALGLHDPTRGQAVIVFVHVAENDTLHYVAQAPSALEGVWSLGDRSVLVTQEGLYALDGLERLRSLGASPPIATLSFDPFLPANAPLRVKVHLRDGSTL